MPVCIRTEPCIDFVSWTKVTKAVFIPQLWTFVTPGQLLLPPLPVGFVVIIIFALYSIFEDNLWWIFPCETGVKIVNPIFERTDSTGYNLSHGAMLWSKRVVGGIRMEKILIEVAGEASLLHRL